MIWNISFADKLLKTRERGTSTEVSLNIEYPHVRDGMYCIHDVVSGLR